MSAAPPARWKPLLLAASLIGAAAVMLAALGSHVVPLPDPADAGRWQTAVWLHLTHAVAMLATAALAQRQAGVAILAAGWLFAGGTLLFCGTLYLRSAGFGPVPAIVAPAGGLCLIAGWLALAASTIGASANLQQ